MQELYAIPISKFVASFLIGLDKGGIPGLGVLGMTLVLYDAQSDSVAHILSIFSVVLFLSDAAAVYAYRKDVEWKLIKDMGPWICLGLIGGFLLIGYVSGTKIKEVTGVALLFISVSFFMFQLLSPKIKPRDDDMLPSSSSESGTSVLGGLPRNRTVVLIVVSILIGLLTVVANVAGPIMAAYFIHLHLQKRDLNGTRAILFLFSNLIKIPTQIALGNLSVSDIFLIAPLTGIAITSTVMTEAYIINRIQQRNFEMISFTLVVIASMNMILSS